MRMIEKLIEVTDKLGWSVQEDGGTYEFAKFSPAGEDFSFSVHGDTVVDIASAVYDYYDCFDVSEHVMLWLGHRGAPDAYTLAIDADEIDEMLKRLSGALLSAAYH